MSGPKEITATLDEETRELSRRDVKLFPTYHVYLTMISKKSAERKTFHPTSNPWNPRQHRNEWKGQIRFQNQLLRPYK